MGSGGLKGPLLVGGSVDVFWVVFFLIQIPLRIVIKIFEGPLMERKFRNI